MLTGQARTCTDMRCPAATGRVSASALNVIAADASLRCLVKPCPAAPRRALSRQDLCGRAVSKRCYFKSSNVLPIRISPFVVSACSLRMRLLLLSVASSTVPTTACCM